MHCFRLSIIAGDNHRIYVSGTEVTAICMVDCVDPGEAMQKATDRLLELGWQGGPNVTSSLLLPPGVDLSSYSDLLKQAYADSKRLGVSLIVYPPAEA
jgi:hypothetical protein